MKNCIVLIFLAVLLLAGCGSVSYRNDYYMDLRALDIPVMVNEASKASPGRSFRAVVSKSSTFSQSTYSGYNYTVTTTTTTSKETTTSLDQQLLSRGTPRDRSISINGINIYSHILGAFGYSENYSDMVLDVTYHAE